MYSCVVAFVHRVVGAECVGKRRLCDTLYGVKNRVNGCRVKDNTREEVEGRYERM